MKAKIEVDVPEWQIGEKVSLYFPDTMTTQETCKINEGHWRKEILKIYEPEFSGCNYKVKVNFYCSKCNKISPWHYSYCPNCGVRMIESKIKE